MIVGVDLGGSTSRALARDGNRYARASGGGANPSSSKLHDVCKRLLTVVGEACGEASPAAIVVGAAGIALPGVADAMREALCAAYPSAIVLCTSDLEIALRAAIPTGDGMLLLAGTGSALYAEVEGRDLTLGGAGYLLGDEGSGYAVGLAALRLLERAYDGRATREAWFANLEAAAEVSDRSSLFEFVYRTPVPVARIASLAPIVIDAASGSERAAMKIVQGAALELAELVRVAIRRLDLSQRRIFLAFGGGLLRDNSLLTFLLETRLTNEAPLLEFVKGHFDPVDGALLLAERLRESR
ncbi:MAG TPA: BadF/BadG/BcrA/BcrD ATPase family protein [Candidatus Dormibacteraeota bacterium]|nr:BadF/BadG/BcrA/BcrD ATPase family protein [Candidatus Dormibacteraeota bacterium]